MSRIRPTSVLTLAVLHLVGGGLGVLAYGVATTVQLVKAERAAATPPQAQPAPAPFGVPLDLDVRMEAYCDQNVPGYPVLKWAGYLMPLFLAVLMVVAGLGLIWMQGWARYLSLVYAVLSILMHLFRLIYTFALVMPAQGEFIQSEMTRYPLVMPAFTFGRMAGGTLLMLQTLFIAYPIVVLCLLLRRSMGVAFTGKGLPPETVRRPRRRYDDDDEDRRPRGWDRWDDDELFRRFRR
jgi:hypothetical protein